MRVFSPELLACFISTPVFHCRESDSRWSNTGHKRSCVACYSVIVINSRCWPQWCVDSLDVSTKSDLTIARIFVDWDSAVLVHYSLRGYVVDRWTSKSNHLIHLMQVQNPSISTKFLSFPRRKNAITFQHWKIQSTMSINISYKICAIPHQNSADLCFRENLGKSIKSNSKSQWPPKGSGWQF